MASMRRPRLKSVKALPDYQFDLTFIDGSRYIVTERESVMTLPGLLPLRDEAAFLAATLADAGWTVEWPAFDIQIGADTLWLDALEQHAKTDAQREFIRWRTRNHLSPSAASEAIGLSPRTIRAFDTGVRPIPKAVILACKGWEVIHSSGQELR